MMLEIETAVFNCRRPIVCRAEARLWNSLPPDIVACDDTLSRFRRDLKTFLFRQSSILF